MYEQIREDTFYIMLYAVVTAVAMIASCYLLFRRANAIAPDVTSPVRVRRWTAAFFSVFVANHLWYMLPLFFLTSSEDIKLTNLLGGLLDSITFFPLAIIVLLTMLQDRQRPLWPAWAMVMPVVVGMVWCVTREQALQALTINCAKQMFIEDERGSIKEGKYADFLLVNKDVLTCPVTEIHEAKPETTFFEGKKVFSM